jgi:RHS repeat-associated protein
LNGFQGEGQGLGRNNYALYGKDTASEGIATVPYKFTDKEQDDTGLYYFGARFYDPEVGRFISVDPARDGVNWYGYCNANPVRYIDPDGKFVKEAWKFIQDNGDAIVDMGTGALEILISDLMDGGTGVAVVLTDGGALVVVPAEQAVSTALKAHGAFMMANAASRLKMSSTSNNTNAEPQFKSQKLLDTHYDKHAVKQGEFGKITKTEYLDRAQKLVTSKPGGNILTKTRTNGDTMYYNKSTNEFGVTNASGNIRTYFKPSDGIGYFNNQ